jgi:hypothetical protein
LIGPFTGGKAHYKNPIALLKLTYFFKVGLGETTFLRR